ncbi:hypothetical protein KR074_002021, partial [Drosophila pseudoananassae]
NMKPNTSPRSIKMVGAETNEFVVEKVLGKRFVRGHPEVLVKWVDFPESESTWEPMANMGNCMGLLADYEAELFERQNSNARQE